MLDKEMLEIEETKEGIVVDYGMFQMVSDNWDEPDYIHLKYYDNVSEEHVSFEDMDDGEMEQLKELMIFMCDVVNGHKSLKEFDKKKK